MHGFLSRDGLAPGELLAVGRHEVEGYGGEIIEATATDLVRDGDERFWVLLADGRGISTRQLPDRPAVDGRSRLFHWTERPIHC
jgi:hypothetical protein